MAKRENSAYDLMVLIDADVPEDRRTAIVQAVKSSIDAGDGDLKGDAEWGVRRLAYEIDHRIEAYYHLFQFLAAPELLRQLQHNLSIDDAVLRHRIIRLDKGIPETTPRPSASAPRYSESEHRGAPDEAPVAATPVEATPAEAAPAPVEAAPVEAAPAAAPVEAAPVEAPEEPAEPSPS
jgi:small subunit ribosomal protein S6